MGAVEARMELPQFHVGTHVRMLNFDFRFSVLVFSKGCKLAVPDSDCLLCFELHLEPRRDDGGILFMACLQAPTIISYHTVPS